MSAERWIPFSERELVTLQVKLGEDDSSISLQYRDELDRLYHEVCARLVALAEKKDQL